MEGQGRVKVHLALRLHLRGPGRGLLSRKHSSSVATTTAPMAASGSHLSPGPAASFLSLSPQWELHCPALFCVDADLMLVGHVIQGIRATRAQGRQSRSQQSLLPGLLPPLQTTRPGKAHRLFQDRSQEVCPAHGSPVSLLTKGCQFGALPSLLCGRRCDAPMTAWSHLNGKTTRAAGPSGTLTICGTTTRCPSK